MVLINKNQVASFGYAVFGRAVLNLDFTSQNIPSELYDDYTRVAALARHLGAIGRRYPWHIEQPGTAAQQAVWDIFLKACACFAKQPDEGGVEPPAIGPRNRSWWYDNDPGVDPIYFNYFMKETLTSLFADVIPDWCKMLITDDAKVWSLYSGTNYGGLITLVVGNDTMDEGTFYNRSWLKTPGTGSKVLHLYVKAIEEHLDPPRGTDVHRQDPGTFDVDTITWNNQPDLGPLILNIPSPFPDPGTWLSIEIGDAEAVCLKTDNEAPGELYEYQAIVFVSHEGEAGKRPFLT